MSLREFFGKHDPAALTLEELQTEILRLAKLADQAFDLWWQHGQSGNVTGGMDAEKMLRADIEVLASFKGNLMAERPAVPAYLPKTNYRERSVIRHDGVIWQAMTSTWNAPHAGSDDWIVLYGTPVAPAPAPIAQAQTIKASTQRKKKAAKDDEEAAEQAFEAEADALFDEMVAESGLSETTLAKPASLGFVLQSGAQHVVSLKHALKSRDAAMAELAIRIEEVDSLKRIEALERKAGIVRRAKPIKRSVTNVLAHDAQGRIEKFEKLEGEQEELDINARLDLVEKRIAEFEGGGIKFRGVWKLEETYPAGSFVSHQGSMWAALIQSKGVKPGETQGCWQLAVKRGRDGKDAR